MRNRTFQVLICEMVGRKVLLAHTCNQPGKQQGRRKGTRNKKKKQGARRQICQDQRGRKTERMQEQAASSLPSSSERSSSSAHHMEMELKEGMESDEEIRRVPEMGLELPGGPSTSGREAGGTERAQASAAAAQASGRRRVRSPADKEHKRLKRLLRNRVSAQQARERKKAYLTDLEVKVKDLEKKNSEMEEKLSTLQNENQMLRQILKNTTVSRRGPGSTASGEGQ